MALRGLFKLGRQKSVPIFFFQLFVLGKFAFDHELFNMINGMDVVHTVEHNTTHFFEALKVTDGSYGVAYKTLAGDKCKKRAYPE